MNDATVDLQDRITHDPAICGGRPIIRGTRVRVSDILELLAAGASRSDILQDYEYLSDADISAAFATLRHCEERSDEAIQNVAHGPGLLRCARNDEWC